MSLAVIGAGKWGEALHFAFSKNHNALITSRNIRKINNFVDLQTALECEYLVFTIPAQVVGVWLDKNFIDKGQKILIASKGIEASSGKFLNEIFSEFISNERLSYLSGPSFASEVLKALPTAISISSKNRVLAREFATFFPDFIKTYLNDDVTGAEICGAYKNVIAIACGVCEGLRLGNNARASLIARGLVEIQRFGLHFGAKEETFLGLSGAGDLFLTASSMLSRNFRVGIEISKGKKLDMILNELGEVAEGVYTSQAINMLATERDIYTPIAREVNLLLNGKSPLQSLKDLMS